MSEKLNVKKIIVSILGTVIVSVAISLLVNGQYGVDTISTLLLGIMNFVDLPFWVLSMTLNIVILLTTLILDRSELGIGSFINALGRSYLLKFLNPVFAGLALSFSSYSMIAAVLGPILFGVGGAIYVSSGLGAAALEALTNIVDTRTETSIKLIRMVLDGLFVLVGVLLGAPLGIGTVLCVLLIGPTLEFTLKIIDQMKLATK